jgi:hypothetical protein
MGVAHVEGDVCAPRGEAGLESLNPAGDPTRQPDAPNTTPRGVALFRVN